MEIIKSDSAFTVFLAVSYIFVIEKLIMNNIFKLFLRNSTEPGWLPLLALYCG